LAFYLHEAHGTNAMNRSSGINNILSCVLDYQGLRPYNGYTTRRMKFTAR